MVKYREMTLEQKREYHRNWYAKNKEQQQEYSKQLYQKNKDHILGYRKAWRVKNKEKIDKANRRRRKENYERIHGYELKWQKKNPWHVSYHGAHNRCNNPKHDGYKYYGAKGIQLKMDMEDFKYLWFRDKAFEMKKPSIDRINHKQHYILENCRFIEHSENSAQPYYNGNRQRDVRGRFI